MRSVCLLANAGAGGGRAADVVEAVERRLREHGCAVRRRTAGSADEATQLTRGIAGEADVLAVVGGDGTVHSALPAVAGTATALGLIPAGSGNDLAAALGVPTDPLAAADLVATGNVRSVDLAQAGDRWWATVLCAGFDSAVAARANRMRWPAGHRRYDMALLAELARLRPHRFTLTLDGNAVPVEATLVAVGNTPQYGGGMRICPDAVVDDGLLDVTVVGRVSRRELLRVAPRLRTGDHLDHPAVSRHRVSALRLDAPGVTAYADGEPVGALPLDLVCR
ncbi:MAG: YegS/Rv2252/BmrU family lipid kinase, partial [Geodermatophilaceae bacterium]|nr:YegS/Rv2252/BmrU family lipid kinase [Geodermatophilaceae bacterium]